MLHLQSFTFNGFSENTYVLHNDQKQCWIIDPGMYDDSEQTAFLEFLKTKQLEPHAILNTHAHIDHVFGVQMLADIFSIPFFIHQKEQLVLDGAVGAATMFGFDFKRISTPVSYYDMERPLMLADDEVKLLFTPGHSPGSVSLYHPAGNWVISGDALFNQSIGRTDLPGGHHATLLQSIKTALLPLPENTQVYSGHGPVTSIGFEKKHNPFLT